MIIKLVPRLESLSFLLLSKKRNPFVILRIKPNPERNLTTQKKIKNVKDVILIQKTRIRIINKVEIINPVKYNLLNFLGVIYKLQIDAIK